MQQIIAFILAVIAFFQGLFGIRKKEDPAPTEPPTVTEPAEEPTEPTPREFMIVFKGANGETLLALVLLEGDVPVYTGDTPEKAATAQYSYAFAGWDSELVPVTGDATYTATFTPSVNSYTVTFKNEGGAVLQTKSVPYGETPAYTGVTPEKAATAQYSYAFAGWDSELVPVTGDATYTATFTPSVNSYTVTFKNEGGAVLETNSVPYGETPVYTGDTPEKAATAQYSYAFAGWDAELVPVTGDATYTATFTPSVNSYTVTFKNEGGAVLQTKSVPYGETPAYTGATPEKAATAQYSYVFAGWDSELIPVTGDATYTATFTETVNSYIVTFKNEGGAVLQTKSVPYGETPAYTGVTPEKAATAQYSYAFAGWDSELVPVTGDATYTATFTETVNSYAVTFKNADGSVLQTKSVPYGETPAYTGDTPAKAPTINRVFSFAGWDRAIIPVTEAAVYTAAFTEAERVWEYDSYTGISYGSSSQVMDICVPRGITEYENVGYLFYIHSGAWTGGTRAEAYTLCTEYAAKGYVTSTMDYRLLGENSTISAQTMVADIYNAMSTAKTLLEAAGVHVGKVVMYGYSAGAHLAMLYTTTQASVSPYPIAFAVDRAGPADMDIAKWTHLMQSYNMGFNTTELKEYIGQLAGNKSAFTGVTDQQLLLTPYQDYLRGFTDVISPAKHVSASTPPAILCYGGKEVLVLTDQRDAIVNAYRNAGAAYTLIEYPNSYHGLESDPNSEALFQQTLKQYFTTYVGY